MSRYSAAVCMRGHFADSIMELHSGAPIDKHCKECGAPVIQACPACGARLLGDYEGVLGPGEPPDNFCTECGLSYPWASREAKILHLENLLQWNDDLDAEQQLEVIAQLAVLHRANRERESTGGGG